jgi:hypothetical protein
MSLLNRESSRPANDAPSSSSSSSSREQFLDATALDAARTWTRQVVRELSGSGRAIAGGWPGTVKEARGLCGTLATRALVARSMSPLARDELGRLTRISYDEARRIWRANESTT